MGVSQEKKLEKYHGRAHNNEAHVKCPDKASGQDWQRVYHQLILEGQSPTLTVLLRRHCKSRELESRDTYLSVQTYHSQSALLLPLGQRGL